jgi:hypothetical protein
VGKLDDIAERNERALRDTKHKLIWVSAIVLALVAVVVALAAGLAVPKTPPHRVQTPQDPTHVNGVIMR